MAKVVILGGGFGGMVAAERLAERLSNDHQITLVSRSRKFVFYPGLVRLAFGKCRPADVSLDLRTWLLRRKVNFIEAEVAHIDPIQKRVTIAHGEVEGKLPYDYLIFALGRRLATEQVPGFYEHAHHLLSIDKALKFRKAIERFREGRAVFGQCVGARLPVPVYEAAFALARRLEKRGDRDRVRITVVSPGTLESELGDGAAAIALKKAFDAHRIEHLSNFRIASVAQESARSDDGDVLSFNLLMLLPPFRGSSAAAYLDNTADEGYINVDPTMHVVNHEGIYAVGDCVNFAGPKMGYMATLQGEVAALNVVAEIDGHEPVTQYSHEMKLLIDDTGTGTIYLHKNNEKDEPATVKQGYSPQWVQESRHALAH